MLHATSKGKGEEYQIISDTKKAIISKYASEHGVASAVRKFKDKKLRDSAVRDWRNYYNHEVHRLRKEAKVGEAVTVDSLPSKKCGKPPFLGAKLDIHLRQLIGDMRSRGTAMGTSVVIGVGTGVVMKHTRKKPAMKLSKEWTMSVLRRMEYTKRKGSSKCKILPDNCEEIKSNFLANVCVVVEMEVVPPSLIINWDHTVTKIVPSSQWTMGKKRS